MVLKFKRRERRQGSDTGSLAMLCWDSLPLFSSVEGSRREPRRHASMGTPKGCFGADDKVVLASTGREAYAGGGFHRGAATTHATRHTQCAWTERAAQQHTASQPAPPPARITRAKKELALAMRTPNAAREGAVQFSRRFKAHQFSGRFKAGAPKAR